MYVCKYTPVSIDLIPDFRECNPQVSKELSPYLAILMPHNFLSSDALVMRSAFYANLIPTDESECQNGHIQNLI